MVPTIEQVRRGPVEREGGVVVLFLVLGLALMVGVGYVAAYVVAHDKVPDGTSVAGVEIGGQSRADAIRALAVRPGRVGTRADDDDDRRDQPPR